MTSILYNDLKTLIIDSELIPEEQYRITNYVTTISKANYTSAGYKFDIVVTALTTNTLYEYATLMANATETYFGVDALLLYNVKYSVTNQVPGYYNDWVDASGKGVIYYMVDDKGNEAPFDFKNIKYNGKFLFNNTLDGTDTSQSVSEYNSVKEVIEDDTFFIPLVSFNNECNNVSIDINAAQVSIYTCSNLQIGKSCSNSIFATVNNVVVGNDFVNSDLDIINGGEIGNNNNGITATNQTNLIIKDNNTTIILGGGNNYLTVDNGVIIDSNNTNVIVGTNAKDVYINDSKTINLGNNIEQFNISSCYDVVVANDCKLFTLNQTNHLTSETLCNSITCNYNDYVTLKNGIENIYVAEGIDNIILDGSQIDFSEYKTITIDDVNYIVNDTTTGESWILNSDGTLSANPNGKLIDAPSDGDVYGRKDGDWVKVAGGGGGISIIPITWSELKALRDSGNLAIGTSYRITDYTCVVGDSTPIPAINLFDIIVQPLNEEVLSENAKAINHEGDLYFANSDLYAWELKYCLDNDTNRFAWASRDDSGKGVIYYMKDEWNNECPYDFKNIRYIREEEQTYCYTFGSPLDDSISGNSHSNTIKPYIDQDGLYSINHNMFGNNSYNNILQYGCHDNTFDSSCYNNVLGANCHSNDIGDNCYSIIFDSNCYSNILNDDCHSNTFGSGCYSNLLNDDCHSNTFGIGCYLNTFGTGCYSNTFGSKCYSNNFGTGCYGNILEYNNYDNFFQKHCTYNKFSTNCHGNTLYGDLYNDVGCNYNTFNSNCFLNIFYSGCNYNTFGNYCTRNKFNVNCSYNMFVDFCASNTFGIQDGQVLIGGNCNNNMFGYNCNSNILGDNNNHNTFGNSCSSNHFYYNCNSNTFGNDCNSNIFGHVYEDNPYGTSVDVYIGDCNYNVFSDNCSYNTFIYKCESNIFGSGCVHNIFGGHYYSLEQNDNILYGYYYNNTFGNDCSYNNFYTGVSGTTNKDYIKYMILEDGISYNNFYSSVSTDANNWLQRIRIKGLSGTSGTPLVTQITLPAANTKYEWVVCYTSGNVLKQYCPDN